MAAFDWDAEKRSERASNAAKARWAKYRAVEAEAIRRINKAFVDVVYKPNGADIQHEPLFNSERA